MSRKKALSLLTVALLSVGGCRFWDRSMQDVMNDPLDKANEVESYPVRNTQMAPLATPRSIIVCRSDAGEVFGAVGVTAKRFALQRTGRGLFAAQRCGWRRRCLTGGSATYR